MKQLEWWRGEEGKREERREQQSSFPHGTLLYPGGRGRVEPRGAFPSPWTPRIPTQKRGSQTGEGDTEVGCSQRPDSIVTGSFPDSSVSWEQG